MRKKMLLTVLLSMFVAVAAQSLSAQATTGNIVVNFSITVDASIATTANISCMASADITDGPSTGRNVIRETAAALATRSGSTATCTVDIPYSWSLTTPSTDLIILGFQITAPAEAAPGSMTSLPSRVSTQSRFAAIHVPVSGTTTTENLTLTF